MWPEIIDWLIARFGYAAAGALAACAASGCNIKPALAAPQPPQPPPSISRPAPHRTSRGRRVAIDGDDYGTCYLSMTAEGEKFSALIDTGSTDLVFGRNMASALGFNPARLSYDETYSSAHGVGHEASVTLREVSLDGVVIGRNVQAKIVETSMTHPLFGTALLKGMRLVYERGNCTLAFNGGAGAYRPDDDGGHVASIGPAPSSRRPVTADDPPPGSPLAMANDKQKTGFCLIIMQRRARYREAVQWCADYLASR